VDFLSTKLLIHHQLTSYFTTSSIRFVTVPDGNSRRTSRSFHSIARVLILARSLHYWLPLPFLGFCRISPKPLNSVLTALNKDISTQNFINISSSIFTILFSLNLS
jgi:hypothetical protein